MDYEKAYNEALERARADYNNHLEEGYKNYREHLETIFPELRESEDERIRKVLINIVKGACNKYGIKYRGDEITEEMLLAYLEKQKEPTTEELYAEAGTTEKEYIANTMKMVRAMRERKKEQKPISQEDFDTAKHEALWDEQKSAWSEENEKIMDTIVSVLGQYIDYKAVSGTGSGYATPRYSKEIDWLKSLRPSWKPSDQDELMKLKYAGTSTKLD